MKTITKITLGCILVASTLISAYNNGFWSFITMFWIAILTIFCDKYITFKKK